MGIKQSTDFKGLALENSYFKLFFFGFNPNGGVDAKLGQYISKETRDESESGNRLGIVNVSNLELSEERQSAISAIVYAQIMETEQFLDAEEL